MPDVLAAIHDTRRHAPSPRRGSDDTIRVTAHLISVDADSYTATVSILGSEPIAGVPCVPSTYTGVTSVHVLMQHGRPVMVVGPASEAVIGGHVPAPPETSEATLTVVAGRVVTPTGSGTYRLDVQAWGRWNDPRHVYQGTSYSNTGPMRGLAWFDSQIVGLGASTITRVQVRVTSNGSPGAGAWTATIQGATEGARPAGAPTFTGSSTSVTVPSADGGVVVAELPTDMREALRTGAARSLGLVGAAYGGTRDWVLVVDYEVKT